MSNERKFRLQVTEEELIALIGHHSVKINEKVYGGTTGLPSVENSERLHDLMKRLHKTTPEIEEIVNNTTETKQEQAQGSQW